MFSRGKNGECVPIVFGTIGAWKGSALYAPPEGARGKRTRKKGLPQQSFHIFKDESFGHELPDGRDGIREHVAFILMPFCFPSQGERLAWGASCDDINVAEWRKIEVAYVCFMHYAGRIIAAQRFAGIRIPFHKGPMVRSCKLHAFGQTARS